MKRYQCYYLLMQKNNLRYKSNIQIDGEIPYYLKKVNSID